MPIGIKKQPHNYINPTVDKREGEAEIKTYQYIGCCPPCPAYQVRLHGEQVGRMFYTSPEGRDKAVSLFNKIKGVTYGNNDIRRIQ